GFGFERMECGWIGSRRPEQAPLPAAGRGIRRARPARRVGHGTNRTHAAPGGVQVKTLVSWSSGKDSAWMVHVLRQRGDAGLGGLLTTINEPAQRVAMHAVRVDLVRAQADALQLPLRLVPIPSPCSNE